MSVVRSSFFILILIGTGAAARKPHVIAFGKWMSIKLLSSNAEAKIRPLLIDGQIRVYATGPFHEITERLFVIRRAYRVNDTLPAEPARSPRWTWQLGGWIGVDRT